MEELKFSKQVVHIKTDLTNMSEVESAAQPVIDFANQHGISLCISFNANHELISTCVAQGRTTAYCKGMVSEVKQLLQDAFGCKLSVIFYAY